jgi:hypothetical protein
MKRKRSDTNADEKDASTGRFLLADGPMMLRDFNPRGVLRFTGRKCMTCEQEIMDHWLRAGSQDYYCSKDGSRTSEGMKE